MLSAQDTTSLSDIAENSPKVAKKVEKKIQKEAKSEEKTLKGSFKDLSKTEKAEKKAHEEAVEAEKELEKVQKEEQIALKKKFKAEQKHETALSKVHKAEQCHELARQKHDHLKEKLEEKGASTDAAVKTQGENAKIRNAKLSALHGSPVPTSSPVINEPGCGTPDSESYYSTISRN